MLDYEGANVLLLGGTGFIGRWVAYLLHVSGANLHVLTRDADRAATVAHDVGFNARVVTCDLRDLAETSAHVRAIQPDVVFNLAGYGVNRAEVDDATAQRINADLVQTLCDAVTSLGETQWRGHRLVHVGSALEYGASTGNLAEDTAERPTTLYGRTKLRGTHALAVHCREHGLRAITARLFTVYGPGERVERLLPSLLRAARSSEPLPLTAGLQQRDFTYVHDVAEGLLRLGVAAAEPGSVVNLASGYFHSVREFVETAADILGIARERLLFGALPTRAEEMWHDAVSNQRLRTLTGWSPHISIAEGIRSSMPQSPLVPSA